MNFRIFTPLAIAVVFAASAFAQTEGGGAVKPTAPKTVPKPKPVTTAAPSITRLPSASEIFEKYIKALGGRDAILKFKTRYQAGNLEITPQGISGTVETFESADSKSLTRVNLNGVGEILEGFDGTTAWAFDPVQGRRIKTGDELFQVKAHSLFYRDVYPERMYSKITVKGEDKVGDRPVFVVIGSITGLPDETLYFDKETGLMLRLDSVSVTPAGQQPTQNYFEEYRETDGVKTPWKVRGVSPLFEIRTTLTTVRNGEPIDNSKFSPPN